MVKRYTRKRGGGGSASKREDCREALAEQKRYYDDQLRRLFDTAKGKIDMYEKHIQKTQESLMKTVKGLSTVLSKNDLSKDVIDELISIRRETIKTNTKLERILEGQGHTINWNVNDFAIPSFKGH